MKQFITAQQIDELSPKQKRRLLIWGAMRQMATGQAWISERMVYSFELHTQLPRLSIGDAIEFLTNAKINFGIILQVGGEYHIQYQDIPCVVGLIENKKWKTIKSRELVDALYELVKKYI